MTHTTETVRLHIRFNGRSEDLDLGALGLHDHTGDAELRAALARHYDCRVDELDGYVIVREPGAIVVRPIAFYG